MKAPEAAPAPRPYRMVARAEAAAKTGERILEAAIELFWEGSGERPSLEAVARRAGVSVQTVIRRFGGRDELFAAAAEREAQRVRHQRDEAPVGDTASAVRVLVDHYEEFGERVLRMLAEESRVPGLREITDRGRMLHREWCERVFAPSLAGHRRAERRRRLAQLVAICDVQTWKLLKIDGGLSRRQAELALVELLEPLLEGP